MSNQEAATPDDGRLAAINKELEEVQIEMARLMAREKKLLQLKEQYRVRELQEKSNELAKQDWGSENHAWSEKVRKVLTEVFGMKDFRAQQLPAINAILSKHDVILLAPTGGGKSLCFQLPALVTDGITVVVSPLISLMQDQVWALKKLGIKAEFLSVDVDKEVVNNVNKMLRDGDSEQLKIVYITPERMAKSNRFMGALQKCYNNKKLAQFAIDEVHCCSQWGHDYRPDYKLLAVLKKMYPDVPILGVTATATAKVLADVQKMLNLRECLIFNAPFNRPNLYYHVLEKPTDKEELYDMLAELMKGKYRNTSGIIYTFTVKETEEISTQLLQRDVKAIPYHAYLDAKQRARTHQKWMSNEVQAVVATVAFGMGIDKADVRFVIHHTMSKSMENFYQESGRAGRDGRRADCILLYRFMDLFRLSTMSFQEYEGLSNLYSMVKYCINGKDCRRKLISRHFAEVWDDTHCNRMCDRCYHLDKVKLPEQDITTYYNTLLAILRRAETLQTKLTALKLVDAWYHKGSPKNRLETPPPLMDRYIGEQLVAFLIVNDYLKEEFQYNAYTTLSYIAKGDAYVGEEGIRFQPAREYSLPKEALLESDCEVVSDGSRSSLASNSKRKSSNGGSKHDSSRVSTSSRRSSDGDSAERKRRRKTQNTSSSSAREDAIKDKEREILSNELRKRNLDENGSAVESDGDDVLFVPNNNEIIEIDET